MRSELALLGLALALGGCDEKPAGPAPERFASVKKNISKSQAAFCEKSFPAQGDGARKYVPAPTRPLGAEEKPAGKGWLWVNAWATWCKPCVEEMGVLNRWKEAISREGLPLSFELLSIDETGAKTELEAWQQKNLPGPIRWLRAEDDFAPFLEGLGIDKSSAIPVHALVDPNGMVRCVRVGAIHEQNYGAVRDLLSGG